MTKRYARLAFSLIALVAGTVPESAKAQKGSASGPYFLNATDSTVAWGSYWSEAHPVLHVHSGDYVDVHTLITSSPHSLMGAGVPADQIEPGDGHAGQGNGEVDITELADGNVGVHVMLPKAIFSQR